MPQNALGGYDLTRFVNEALIYLRLRLGIAGRIHRGYEPNPQQRGSTITIPIRGDFEVRDAPSDPQNIDAGKVSVTLDHWKEVKFKLPDNEGQYTQDQIIEDHIEPAATALAEHIDGNLAALYARVPYAHDATSDLKRSITRVRKVLADNRAPMNDRRLHLAVDHELEALMLEADFFSKADTVGGTLNQRALLDGSLGRRFGFEIFPHGLIRDHTSGTVVSAGSDVAGALTAGAAKGATSIAVGSLSGAQTIKKGDAFVIAGHTQRYVATADVTLSSGAGTIPVFPALARAYDSGSVVTFEDGSGASVHADRFSANIAFHRDWATLATAPLQDLRGSRQAAQQGIQIETVTDAETRLTLRGRMWYEPNSSDLRMALDILYGFEILNPNLAALLRRDI